MQNYVWAMYNTLQGQNVEETLFIILIFKSILFWKPLTGISKKRKLVFVFACYNLGDFLHVFFTSRKSTKGSYIVRLAIWKLLEKIAAATTCVLLSYEARNYCHLTITYARYHMYCCLLSHVATNTSSPPPCTCSHCRMETATPAPFSRAIIKNPLLRVAK